MKITDIEKVKELFTFFTGSSNYRIREKRKGEQIPNLHPWENERTYHYHGAFLIANSYNKLYWFLLVERDGNHHLWILPENRNTTLIQINKVDRKGEHHYLVWNYSPTKHDGRNDKRKEVFETLNNNNLSFSILIPQLQSDVNDFLDKIFFLVNIRLQSDKLDKSQIALSSS